MLLIIVTRGGSGGLWWGWLDNGLGVGGSSTGDDDGTDGELRAVDGWHLEGDVRRVEAGAGWCGAHGSTFCGKMGGAPEGENGVKLCRSCGIAAAR